MVGQNEDADKSPGKHEPSWQVLAQSADDALHNIGGRTCSRGRPNFLTSVNVDGGRVLTKVNFLGCQTNGTIQNLGRVQILGLANNGCKTEPVLVADQLVFVTFANFRGNSLYSHPTLRL